MSDIAIRVENLSKQYRIGKARGKFRYKSLRDSISEAAVAPFRRAGKLLRGEAYGASGLDETFWALKDVSFEVKQGEAVGVIGRNGAGKSTLLKVLSEITEPSAGRVELHGRVASLLEVGTGFHPELTGRDNIYLNGAIMGMKRGEINRKFDEIVAFAEVEKFIDTPVKHYSSGMYVRLAFAVAAHVEPEILLVDEVLAVGDAAFQKKCLGKMGEVAQQGRTVLFVSHNMGSVRQICQKGIVLRNGQVYYNGRIADAIERAIEDTTERTGTILSHLGLGHPDFSVSSVLVNDSPSDELSLSPAMRCLKITIEGSLAIPHRMELEASIMDRFENRLGFFSPGHERGHTFQFPAGPFSLTRFIEIPARLNSGDYYLNLTLTHPDVISWVDLPRSVHIRAEGTPTQTGRVLDYYRGVGWIFLGEPTDKAGSNPENGVGDAEI